MTDWEQSEFRRLIDIGNIERQPHTFSIEASAQERKELARRFSLLSIESLGARGTLVQGADHSRIRLHAHLEAEVAQQCVVTLETVIQRIQADFCRDYDRDSGDQWAGMGNGGEEIFLSLDSDDLPEPVVGGAIDVGEAVAEQLALELDPFPRTSQAKLDEVALKRGQRGEESEPANSFSALASVKAKLKKG